MKKLHPHWMQDCSGKKSLCRIAVVACAGFAGWHAFSGTVAPPADAASSDAFQPKLRLSSAVYAGAPSSIAPPAQAGIDPRTAASLWSKAKRDVAIRQKKLDKARADYLRIRRSLTKAGLFDDAYTALARERVEDAADALREARSILEQQQLAYQSPVQAVSPSQDLTATER